MYGKAPVLLLLKNRNNYNNILKYGNKVFFSIPTKFVGSCKEILFVSIKTQEII